VGTGVANGVSLSDRSHVTVSKLVVSGTTGPGVSVFRGDHVSILGNEVTQAGQPLSGQVAAGIRLSGTTNGLVKGNETHHNSDDGILLSGGTTGTTVANNVSAFNAQGYQRDAAGINVASPANTIVGNNTHDNEDSGIHIYSGGHNNLAVGNVTYNNGDHGIDNLSVTGGRLIGNTVFRNCTTGINVEGASSDYIVANNVAVDNAVHPAYNDIRCSRRKGNIGIWDSAPATTTVDHNLVHLTKDGTMYGFGSSYSSLAAMAAATGQEEHGVQGDPKFKDSAAWDLSLTAGSPAIDRANSGLPGQLLTDIAENPRTDDPNTPNTDAEGPRLYDDLGAYEFRAWQAPTARLSVTPSSGTVAMPVTADAGASSDPQGQVLSYSFDFGDGTGTVAQASPTATHTYGTAGSYTVTVKVTSTTSGLSATSGQSVAVSAATGTRPSFVNTIANNYSTTTKTSGSITVWRAGGVRAGDLVVVTVQLSGTAPHGTVLGTDAAGNTYSTAATVSDDAGNRLVVLSGIALKPLAVNDKITVSFPSASTYRLSGDEFAGVTRMDQSSTATGTASTFSSATAQATTGNQVAVGAVSVPTGAANPTWASGWIVNGSYATSSQYLSKAYQLPGSGGYAATGGASGAWLAAVVTLRS
jgi:parallel beta-helix repeat protein